MDRLKQGGGNWFSGKHFWDREEELALFVKRLDEGTHILLTAQRRMGKTSLMREAMERMKERYTCLFVDLQKATKPADAIAEIGLAVRPLAPIWEKTKRVFGNILETATKSIEEVDAWEFGFKLKAGMTSGMWAQKGDHLLSILADMDNPVILMLDEVPIFVNGILKGDDNLITPERRNEADAFMSWLRDNSMRHKGKVRMVLSGSIGFEPVLNQANLSATINTFQPFELKPWTPEIAQGCIEALANEYGVLFHDGAAAEMVRRLGCCIPHLVRDWWEKRYGAFHTPVLERGL